MPAGYIAVTKSMEYIGHFKCMLRCPPASALGWPATSVLYTKEGTGRTSQQPRCFLGCLRGVLSPLQQLLPVSWQAGPGQPGGRRAPCTVVATGLGDHTRVKAGWMVLKEGNNFISCHIICFLDLSYSVFFCCVISTKKKKNPDEKKHVETSTQKWLTFILFERFITWSRLPLGNITLTRCGQHFYSVWNIFFEIYVLPLFIVHTLCILQTRVKKTQEIFWDSCWVLFSSPSKEVIDTTRYPYPMHIQMRLQLSICK